MTYLSSYVCDVCEQTIPFGEPCFQVKFGLFRESNGNQSGMTITPVHELHAHQRCKAGIAGLLQSKYIEAAKLGG